MDVYKGIYPLYSQMIEHLAEAPLLAVMITGEIEIFSILPLSPVHIYLPITQYTS